MVITDLNGEKVEILYLPLAMQMADYYRRFKHRNPLLAAGDTWLCACWADVYAKLLKLHVD